MTHQTLPRPGTGPAVVPARDPAGDAGTTDAALLVALARGTPLTPGEEGTLLRQSRAGTSAAAVVDLGLLTSHELADAQRVVDAGVRARVRLLESVLDVAVTAAVTATPVPSRAHLLAAVTALADALDHAAAGAVTERAGESGSLRTRLLEEVTRSLQERAGPDRADDPGPGESSAWPWPAVSGDDSAAGAGGAAVTVAAMRALLLGAPLEPRERAVLVLRFGTPGTGPMSLADAAQALGTTRQEVRRVESRLLARLRRHPSVAARRPAQSPDATPGVSVGQ